LAKQESKIDDLKKIIAQQNETMTKQEKTMELQAKSLKENTDKFIENAKTISGLMKVIEQRDEKLHILEKEVEGIEEMNNVVKKAISVAESESKAYLEVKFELNELKSRK